MDILDYINNTCPKIVKEIKLAHVKINGLKDYEKPEYLHLLSELRFSVINLYTHDIDQPEYETLQCDFYEVMINGLKLRNYCDLIQFSINSGMDNYISEVKTMYFKYFDEY